MVEELQSVMERLVVELRGQFAEIREQIDVLTEALEKLQEPGDEQMEMDV